MARGDSASVAAFEEVAHLKPPTPSPYTPRRTFMVCVRAVQRSRIERPSQRGWHRAAHEDAVSAVGWHPGEGRTPIPMSESEFLAKISEWASQGAACPGEAGSSRLPGGTH